MVEHCGPNAEAMGSNPVEALKWFFAVIIIAYQIAIQLQWSHLHNDSICTISAVHILTSFYVSFHSRVDDLIIKWRACHCMSLHSSDGRALRPECRGHRFESCWNPEMVFFFGLILQLLKLQYNYDGRIFIPFVFPLFTIIFTSFYMYSTVSSSLFSNSTCTRSHKKGSF